jgi:hypothetical protein
MITTFPNLSGKADTQIEPTTMVSAMTYRCVTANRSSV